MLIPPGPGSLWIGLAIAVLAPIAITPIVRLEPFDALPGLPYMLAVVFAALFGRLLAGGVATIASVLLLNAYVIPPPGLTLRVRDLLEALLFIVVALVVSILLVRLERARSDEAIEREQLAFVSKAGDAMSGPLDVDSAVTQLAGVLVPVLADWFAVDLVQDDGQRNVLVMHPDPSRIQLARDLQAAFPTDPDAPTGAPAVIRTGRSELTEEITEEMLDALVEDPRLRATISELAIRCAMVVPLTARGRTLGALTLFGAETHTRYGPDDLRLAEEVADRAAVAIDTAYLFAAESRARATATEQARRNEILKDVTAAFGLATTVQEAMEAMLDEGIRLAGASAGTVGLVADGDRVELIGTSGYEIDDHPYWQAFDLEERLPMSEAILERRPIVISTTAERDRRYPSLIGRGEQRDHVLVCLPLMLGREAIGGFSASYAPNTEFGEDDLAFLLALGEQCAQAIDRLRSVERERETRARFNALASSSRTLARSLDYDVTATTIVQLATEHLGASATLYVRSRDSYTILAEHRRGADPTVVGDAGPVEAPPELVAEVVASLEEGRPRVLPPESDTGEPPGVVLPLRIAQSVVGALVVTDAMRDYTRTDELDFAREVARRMARALENARLYRERDYAAKTLQQSLLPPELPEILGIEVATMFLPAIRGYEVGGDFYDLFQVRDGRWAAVIGDVCGKGVEAAALTGLARHTLRAVSHDVERPSQPLVALNDALLREHLDDRFCTVAYVLLEPTANGARVQIASGGHPLPHHVSADGGTRTVGRPGTLLGIIEDPHLEDAAFTLGPGEALVMFTDGIFRRHEAFGDGGAGLEKQLGAAPPGSATALSDRIRQYVQDLIAGEQDDDIAVMVLLARPA